jgi:uncharacterized protein
MQLTLNLTHACNLACTYCYAGAPRAQHMSRGTVVRALDLGLGECRAGGELQLSFFGGEPLLRWDTLRWATDLAAGRCREAGVTLRPTITTNGSLLSLDRVTWLADRGFAVAISIDGDQAGHDATRPLAGGGSSFALAMAGVHAALPSMPNLEAIMVVAPDNVERVDAGVRHLAAEGVRCISLNPDFYAQWTDDALTAWERQWVAVADFFVQRFRDGADLYLNFVDTKIITRLKKGFACGDRCRFGEGEVAVAPSGRLYPCERLVGEDTGELAIGHVDSGYDETVRQPLLTRRGGVDPGCLECALQPRCMTWCGCINHATTGAIDRVHGLLCLHERLSIREADRAAGILWEEQNPLLLRKYYRAG